MDNIYFKKQFDSLAEVFRNKPEFTLFIAIQLLLLFTALKISLFNFVILPRHSIDIFMDKLCFTLLLLVILSPLLLMIRKRSILIFLYIIQTVYIVINISYNMYFHDYLNMLEIPSVLREGLTAASHFSAPFSAELLISVIDLPFFAFVVMNYNKSRELARKLQFFVVIAVLISAGIVAKVETERYHASSSILQGITTFFGESKIIENYGTIAYNISSLHEGRDAHLLANSLKYGAAQSGKDSGNERPNFVVIQVEALDANVVDKMHNGNYIAPFLHSLSENCIFYPYTLSYHMGGRTSDAEFSILNSVQPLIDYPALKIPNYTFQNSLVKQLLASGYRTVSYHGNIGEFFNRDVAFKEMGFENFSDINKMGMKDVGWGAPDDEVFGYETAVLKNIKQPFFAYTITMSSHTPFVNASRYYNNSAYDDVKNKLSGDYFNSISYVDETLKSFVETVGKNFPNTYIFIIGDHTPSVDTDYYKQASFSSNDRYFEFVPLFIITPDHRVRREREQAACFLDIAPTILKASGISFEIRSDGSDLLDPGSISPQIPFGDNWYARAYLYRSVEDSSDF